VVDATSLALQESETLMHAVFPRLANFLSRYGDQNSVPNYSFRAVSIRLNAVPYIDEIFLDLAKLNTIYRSKEIL